MIVEFDLCRYYLRKLLKAQHFHFLVWKIDSEDRQTKDRRVFCCFRFPVPVEAMRVVYYRLLNATTIQLSNILHVLVHNELSSTV